MRSLRSPHRRVALVFWMLAIATIPIWFSVSQPAWDASVYARAMRWVAAGQDPYAEGVAQEEAYYRNGPQTGVGVPFAYVYSPLTLPLLKLASSIPAWLLKSEYWLVYALCALAQVVVTSRAAENGERRWMELLAPAALFFPGLLVSDVIQSGNIAYILYGAALATAYLGWRRQLWLPFYVVVVAASCFKAPYLSLLAIPVFSSRRQYAAASAAAAAGVGLFAVQPWLWPVAFHNYLRAVEMQFVWNRDFGASPAGQFGALLDQLHGPFEMASWVFYACYAVPVVGLLMVLGRRYQRGQLSLGEWMPVVLVGVILLNPRNIEYDLVPLTVPMMLVGMRLLARFKQRSLMLALGLEHFIGVNVAVVVFLVGWWRSIDCLLVVACFAGGCWDLVKRSEPVALPSVVPIGERGYGLHEVAS